MSSELYQVTAPPPNGVVAKTSRGFDPDRDLQDLSTARRAGTFAVVILPFVAFLYAIYLLWGWAVGWLDLALLLGMHVVCGLGITVGYHRLLTHSSFETKPWVRGLFTIMGSLAIEGPPSGWVADHRRHHTYSDDEGDPHSPHGYGPGFWGGVKGAYHAHIGWMFRSRSTSVQRFAPKLLKDKAVMRIDRLFPIFIPLAILIPAVLGFVLSGGQLKAALTGAFWGGAVRIFVTHHVTWSINSICHMIGPQDFESDDESRNVWWLALVSLGESWHNGHHAFPGSAFHGLKPWQQWMDPSAWVIIALQKTGLAWNVKRPSQRRLAAKAIT